jgi:NADPH-dependent curcumin reductase CurA
MNLEGGVVATVVESKSDNFKVGDTVVGTSMEGNILQKKIKYKSRFKHSRVELLFKYTRDDRFAYFGLMDICKPKPGKLS